MTTTNFVYQWPPLESDPEIFNRYFQELGLPPFIGFQELLSFDLDDNSTQNECDFPVFGVIVALNRPHGSYYYTENLLDSNSIPFFMRQTKELDYACGLIAALHILGNNSQNVELSDKCILKDFFERSKYKNEMERARMLEESYDFKQKHQIYSNQGQTQFYNPNSNTNNTQNNETKGKIIHHFISFCIIDQNLVQLDGTLPGPLVIKRNVDQNKLLSLTVNEIKQMISENIVTEDLSILFLTYC